MDQRQNETDYYDKTKLFKSQIAPIIRNLKIECNKNRLPMHVIVAVKNDEASTHYESDAVLASTGITLTEDRIAMMILQARGFKYSLPSYIQKDIRELSEYLERISENEEAVLGIDLKEDKISGLRQTALGGGRILPPGNIVEKPITDEFLDD